MSAAKIRALNDAFRTTMTGGRVIMTAGVQALGEKTVASALTAVREFTAFSADNDPHREPQGTRHNGNPDASGEANLARCRARYRDRYADDRA